jgi:hypothetical protein
MLVPRKANHGPRPSVRAFRLKRTLTDGAGGLLAGRAIGLLLLGHGKPTPAMAARSWPQTSLIRRLADVVIVSARLNLRAPARQRR